MAFGSGSDLLLGGFGDDDLTGSAGNDFLVGGDGRDRIVGSAGHDILVAAELAYHFTEAALRAVLAGWAANKEPDDGLADDILDEALIDGEDFDLLTGSSGSDWFILSETDRITDFKVNKTQQDAVTWI